MKRTLRASLTHESEERDVPINFFNSPFSLCFANFCTDPSVRLIGHDIQISNAHQLIGGAKSSPIVFNELFVLYFNKAGPIVYSTEREADYFCYAQYVVAVISAGVDVF